MSETTKGLKLTLYTYADVSTGHISENDARQLAEDAANYDAPGPGLVVLRYPEGFFVNTAVADDADAMREQEGRYTPELLGLLRVACEQGAFWLRLDADGHRVEGAKTFDW